MMKKEVMGGGNVFASKSAGSRVSVKVLLERVYEDAGIQCRIM